jgi:uncharacterized protein YlxW (UPF0749 family)
MKKKKSNKPVQEDIENCTLADLLRDMRRSANAIQSNIKALEDMLSDVTSEAKQEVLELFKPECE